MHPPLSFLQVVNEFDVALPINCSCLSTLRTPTPHAIVWSGERSVSPALIDEQEQFHIDHIQKLIDILIDQCSAPGHGHSSLVDSDDDNQVTLLDSTNSGAAGSYIATCDDITVHPVKNDHPQGQYPFQDNNPQGHSQIFKPSEGHVPLHCYSGPEVRDVFYPDKTCGHMVLEKSIFNFVGPDRQPLTVDTVDKMVAVANIILDTGVPNYKMARIPIQSNLNIEAWERYTLDYGDHRLIQYLRFGFPLSLSESRHLINSKSVSNHASACHFPEAVDEYIHKERSHGAILGPISHIPHSQFHCSPLMTRPKDGNKRRVILDLSYPKGSSLNTFVDSATFDQVHFRLKFPSIDQITTYINTLHNPRIAKVDISRAFRHLKIDPADALKLGLFWNNSYYIDANCPFGFVHGSAAFQMVSDLVAHAMKVKGFTIFPYLDDYILVAEEDVVEQGFQALCTLMQELGLPMNMDKLTAPTLKMPALGIDIDIVAGTISIARDKMVEINQIIREVSGAKVLSKAKFQSLTGKLLYIHKCVRPARVFLNRILALLHQNHGKKRIYLTHAFFRDINWFVKFMHRFNGVVCFHKQSIPTESAYIDASLTGLGGFWSGQAYATPISGFSALDLGIVHLEMVNIIIALKLWGSAWSGKHVIIHCDNWAVVQSVQKGNSKDKFLQLCLRNIWLLIAFHDIDLELRHIKGVDNIIADTLSRIYSSKEDHIACKQVLLDSAHWCHIDPSFFMLDTDI